MIKELFEDGMVDTFLRYGLFLGAVFQIICIGAVVIMPDSKAEYSNESDGSEDDEGSDQGSPSHSSSYRHPRSSKREKKKRR